MKLLVRVLLALALLPCALARASRESRGYLLVSSPEGAAVHFARLLTAAEEARGERLRLHRLTRRGQLARPHGLAVDPLRRVLYVADTGAKAIVAIRLLVGSPDDKDGGLTGDGSVVLLQGIDVEWITVDSTGALFCTDTMGKTVWTLPAEAAMRRLEDGSSEPLSLTELYPAAVLDPLREPRGIAVDGISAYWAVADGPEDGAVLMGYADQSSDGEQAMRRIVNTTSLPFGICLTGSRLFVTTQSGELLSTRLESNETPVLVSDKLQRPRGCAFDGDNTVFVADEEAGRIYAISGGSPRLGARPVWPVLEAKNAYGLAVLPSSSLRLPGMSSMMLVLLAALWTSPSAE